MRIVLAALSCFIFVSASEARPGHGGGALASPPITAPVLTSSNVNFGVTTRTGRGGVRLSQQDVTTTADHPVTFSGTGLLTSSGPACDTWTLTFVSNSSGRPSTDFTLPAAGVAEGPSAITPVPSSTGQGNLAGTYVWNVSCVGNGQASNTVQLTYSPVANAVNIGSADHTDFGVYPSGFGNVAGAKILLSTGFYAPTTRIVLKQGGTFANQVTVQNADVNKLANITNFAIGSTSNIRLYALVASGDQSGLVANGGRCTFCSDVVNGVTYTDNVYDSVFGYFSEATMGAPSDNSFGGFGGFGGCTSGCQIVNSGIDYTQSGIGPKNNSVAAVTNTWIRHPFNNCHFLNSSGTSSAGWIFLDDMCIAPSTGANPTHPDFSQVADQGTPFNTTYKHFIQTQMEGDQVAQGVPFGGGPLGVGGLALGYVDDGTAGHGPGKILTLTSGAFGSASDGSRIWSPAGSPVGLSDQVQMSRTSATKATLALASDVNIGSVGSPVNWYSISSLNFNVNGMIYDSGEPTAASWAGENGSSSFTNFAVINHAANPFYETSFTGTIASDILTVSGTITNNIPTTVQPYWIAGTYNDSGGRLKYTGCNYCSSTAGIQYQITGDNRGTFTGSQSGTTLHVATNPTIGPLQVGDIISGGTIPVPTGSCTSGCVWTKVVSQITTQGGDVATYTVSTSQTVASATLTGGAPNGTGTYRLYGSPGNVGPTAMSTSFSYPQSAGGAVYFKNCSTTELHGGTLTVDSGYATAFNNSPACPNATLTNTKLNSALSGSDYASGMLPVTYLDQFSFAQRAAADADQVRLWVCLAFKPAIGGALDMGGGKWYGPITGETNVNGTGGGDWISEYTGANAYKSDGTHITGCENTP